MFVESAFFKVISPTFPSHSEFEIENPKWSSKGGLHDALSGEGNVCCSAPPKLFRSGFQPVFWLVTHELLPMAASVGTVFIAIVVGGRIWTNFKSKCKLRTCLLKCCCSDQHQDCDYVILFSIIIIMLVIWLNSLFFSSKL